MDQHTNKLPLEIRKALLVLGLPATEVFDREKIIETWKNRMITCAVDAEQLEISAEAEALEINSAKDQIVRWLGGC